MAGRRGRQGRMDKIKLLVKRGGTREFSPPRLERMLRDACFRFFSGRELEVKAEKVGDSKGDIKEPLKIEVRIPCNLMNTLCSADKGNSRLREFAAELGKTAKRLYSENGWPVRRVELTFFEFNEFAVAPSDVSWSG